MLSFGNVGWSLSKNWIRKTAMVYETFAERKRRQLKGGEPEIYRYDEIVPQLRHQINTVMIKAIGRFYVVDIIDREVPGPSNRWWHLINQVCDEEIYSYTEFYRNSVSDQRYLNYLSVVEVADDYLSAVEIGCKVLAKMHEDDPNNFEQRVSSLSFSEAVDQINRRFSQHAVGYRLEAEHIIQLNSEILHQNVVLPTLKILSGAIFTKANDEFFRAYDLSRQENYKDCITAANRAFECVLKAICETEKWEYAIGSRASELINRVTEKGLFTHSFDKTFISYTTMLKSGIPEVRNQGGGHGGGLSDAEVTAESAKFALNLTGSSILFVGNSYEIFLRNRNVP